MSNIGIVTIGRNEGTRLVRCLRSILDQVPQGTPVVYVDSGSTDGSVAFAESLGIHVVRLDMSRPFTMARGRNTGFNVLIEQFADLDYVQFIDGDCELMAGWLQEASTTLDQHPQLAVVCGRLHERFPEATPYNRLADMEWNTPIGEAKACGGIAMMRVSALNMVNGYNMALICGEEPEMCIRLRQQGWTIRRIAADMAIHDMAMTRFRQWWTRSVRGGWAVAEGAAMYGRTEERYMVREAKSGWLWGYTIPAIAIGGAAFTSGWSLTLLAGYLYLATRVYQYCLKQGHPSNHALLYSLFCTLSKLPQAVGQTKYWLTRWRGQPATIIEYKTATTPLESSSETARSTEVIMG